MSFSRLIITVRLAVQFTGFECYGSRACLGTPAVRAACTIWQYRKEVISPQKVKGIWYAFLVGLEKHPWLERARADDYWHGAIACNEDMIN